PGFEPGAVALRLALPIRSPSSAQRESNPHIRPGEAVGYRYIMGTITVPGLPKNREHRVGLEPTLPHYGCGVLAAGPPVPATEGAGWRSNRRLRLFRPPLHRLSHERPRCERWFRPTRLGPTSRPAPSPSVLTDASPWEDVRAFLGRSRGQLA